MAFPGSGRPHQGDDQPEPSEYAGRKDRPIDKIRPLRSTDIEAGQYEDRSYCGDGKRARDEIERALDRIHRGGL